MDLSSITQRQTARAVLTNPLTDEPLVDDQGAPMWIEVYGSESPQYRKNMFEFRRVRVEAGQDVRMGFEETEEEGLILLAALTRDWNVQVHGEHPACTAEAAQSLYQEQPWIKTQVDEVVHRRSGFFDVASTDSSQPPSTSSG